MSGEHEAPAPGTVDSSADAVGPPADPDILGSVTSRADIDPAASERTMTRRELRILRARAEAAGLPAPDVMFLPNGESTVTGAIPVLDGVAFSGQSDVAPEPDVAPEADAAGVVTEEAVTDASPEPGPEPEPEEVPDAPAQAAAESTPETTSAEPVVDVEEAGSDQRSREDDVSPAPVADGPEVIPALVEPEPTGSARFPATTSTADVPAEIVVEAEPATADHPVPVASPDEARDGVAGPTDPPAAGNLRPFDAMFLPPSARTEGDDEPGEPLLDTASAQPANDTHGLRGDILAAPAGAARPFGHWSTQDAEDDDATGESALSRDVGTGVLTTHALVLPSIPDAGEPLMSPLTSTGEVMVTGMVELPKSYGSTGAHPALFDHPEVDSLIDDADREDADSGAAPVRATRAVSSTTTTRSMIETAPTRRSRVLPIVGIAVGVVILVAAAIWALAEFAFNAF